MLTVETIGRIRREHFLKGKTIKEISRDLRVSRNTVRRVLRSGATSFEYEREVQPRPKLGRWTEELDTLLAANAAKSAREQLTLMPHAKISLQRKAELLSTWLHVPAPRVRTLVLVPVTHCIEGVPQKLVRVEKAQNAAVTSIKSVVGDWCNRAMPSGTW
jgi:AraC-like DNA-binding protein